MPFELQIAPGSRLARVRGYGPDGFAATRDALRAIGEDPRLPAGVPVLMDVRELEYQATPPEVSQFAAPDQISALFAGRRVALLVRHGMQFGVSRVFAAKAEQAGSVTEVFVEEREALAWLASAP